MNTVVLIVHVVGAVFLIGPMALLPMTGLRALRSGQSEQVRVLARSTMLFSLLSLIVVVAGFALVGLAPERYSLSLTTPWVLASIILTVLAIVLNLVVVVPRMRAAAELMASGAAAEGIKTPGYGAIAATSGMVCVMILVTTVLMVWKP